MYRETSGFSTEDYTERRKAYDDFIEEIAGVFDMAMSDIGHKADSSWPHLRHFSVEVWKHLPAIASAEWESWPRNLVFRIKSTIEGRRLESVAAASRKFCEYCNGNGFFTGIVSNPDYYNGKPMKSCHTIICKGCNNAQAIFGERTIKSCNVLYPLESVTGSWPYIEAVVSGPPLEVWPQALSWKEVSDSEFPSKYTRKENERSQVA